MSTSAKLLINQIRAVTGEAEITPERLATVLDQIYDECNEPAGIIELPEHLSEERINSIGVTAQSALSNAATAQSQANGAATMAQTAINNASAADTKAQSAIDAAAAADTKAQSALDAANAASGCTCSDAGYSDYKAICETLEIPFIAENLYPNA